jgi:hypothetical protein
VAPLFATCRRRPGASFAIALGGDRVAPRNVRPENRSTAVGRSPREIAATLAEQGHVTANLTPYALTTVALTIDQENGKRRRAA